MAVRFMDSFDHYATADILAKYNSVVGSNTISAVGRNGTNGYNINSNSGTLGKVLDSQATWITGIAWKNNASAISQAVLLFYDGATLHMDLYFDITTTFFSVRRNGTVLATGTTPIVSGRFYFLELKITIADAGGVAQLKINGTTDINFTGDTRNGANASADRFFIGLAGTTNVAMIIDDLYVCDGTGSSPTNDFLGDIRVQALFPNGNGNSSQLVGSDSNSTDNYLLVDETAPAVADYVQSNTVSDKDTYTMTDLTPTAGTVYGVQVLPYAAKTDAGVRSIASVARVSATEVDSADKTLSVSAQYLPDVRETKPGGGVWTISDVNSAEFGVKVTA